MYPRVDAAPSAHTFSIAVVYACVPAGGAIGQFGETLGGRVSLEEEQPCPTCSLRAS